MKAQLSRATAAAGKTRWLVTGMVAAGLAALGIFIGVTGCGTTPTKFESRFYDIDTNLMPRVVWVTNVGGAGSGEQGGQRSEVRGQGAEAELAASAAGDKGEISGLGAGGGKQGAGSLELGAVTNVALATNYEASYTYTPNERARTVSAVAGNAAGLLGPIGELVALLCAGAFGVWGQIRSSRATRVAGVLAQVIETGRAVLQQSPQGQKLDEQWKNWMITHQAEQGVIEDVVKLLATVVDDGTAKDAAARLLALMGKS